MKEYTFNAEVTYVVKEQVTLTCRTDNYQEALDAAEATLEQYPLSGDSSCIYCYSRSREILDRTVNRIEDEVKEKSHA